VGGFLGACEEKGAGFNKDNLKREGREEGRFSDGKAEERQGKMTQPMCEKILGPKCVVRRVTIACSYVNV
jgi:hypothetical protein